MNVFAVVENAGTDEQHAVKFSRDIRLCIGWLQRHYSETEIESLKVDIMLQRKDGTLTTEY